ncbi:MAG: BON domain-containing protein [Steroidobacteraceae bacterium]
MNINKTLATAIAATVMLGTIACSATRTQRAAGEQVDDAVVLTNVKSALIANPVTEGGEINVDVNRGVVQLNGFVDSADEKSSAGKLARKVDGVKDVENNLKVSEGSSTAGEVIDDSVLTAKVKAALIENSDTKAHQINVETKNGVVQLGGFVDDAAAKAAAGSVAMSVKGVKNVKNDLQVKTN